MLCKATLNIQESRKSIICLKGKQELIKRSNSFMSCYHMNHCPPEHTTSQFTYSIYYSLWSVKLAALYTMKLFFQGESQNQEKTS